MPSLTPERKVKCLVWDLDDTLWEGVLLEGDRPLPFAAALDALQLLDARGILHAVASRGDHGAAVRHLTEHGLTDMFCALEIGWGAKSESVRRIAESLDIGLDAIAFVDNDAVERAEVAAALPMLRCYPAENIAALGDLVEFQPEIVTDESRQRRHLYQAEAQRCAAERQYSPRSTEFLAALDLTMTIRRATAQDLPRAYELTHRTHQLNTTGLALGMAELTQMCESADHEVLVAQLQDRFGSYGTIGLAVSELAGASSVLKLMLMSCRVMSRGVGVPMLDHLIHTAIDAGRRPVAHFVPTGVNRVMLVTLRFAGYSVVEHAAEHLVLAVDPSRSTPARASHVRIRLAEDSSR